MSWLVPLGFLGLIGIAVLIIIYIIKPNYQNKIVSSTFVWKLSLKYRKKRIPVNRLRSLLLLICQILIIIACALIMAQPVIMPEANEVKQEKIVVIDASASMLAAHNGTTRFERAVAEVKSVAEDTFHENGLISIILAGTTASWLTQRYSVDQRDETLSALDLLVSEDGLQCSYGEGDIDGAMDLAQIVLDQNDQAQVFLYTGSTYYDTGIVNVVNVSEEGEWNAAILDVVAEKVENLYTFTVQVACYGKDVDLVLHCNIFGANGNSGSTINLTSYIRCEDSVVQEYVFITANETVDGVDSFDQVYFFLEDVNDSYEYDNFTYVYGGAVKSLKVQYYSTSPNSFFYVALSALRSQWPSWDLEVTYIATGASPELSGYDIYIFEHKMPEHLPTDGVVFLCDIDKVPDNLTVTIGDKVENDLTMVAVEDHQLLNYISLDDIIVSSYTRITSYDGFLPLIYCGGDPVLLLKDEPTEKIVILSLDVNVSDITMFYSWATLITNIFDYFFPATVSDHTVEVGSTVTLNARGETLTLSYPSGTTKEIDSFPELFTAMDPGIYTVTQTLMAGEDSVITDNFYVKIPSSQSNIFMEIDELYSPVVEQITEFTIYDLLIYFAATLVALLFLEWWLQSRDNS